MTDYRNSTPLFFPPPQKEAKGDGEPLYPDKWPQFSKEIAMPHYADGSLAKVGDKVKGKPYNTAHEVVGELIQITPGSEVCNCVVAFADVKSGVSGQYGPGLENGEVFTATTVNAEATDDHPAGQMYLRIVPKFDYGETKAFTKV